MSLPCPVLWCDRPMPGGRRICGACEAETLRELADVPSLARHLEISISRQAQIGEGGGGHSDDERPLPWDERAAEAAHALKAVLVSWVRLLGDGVHQLPGPVCASRCEHRSCVYTELGREPADDLASIARWLLRLEGPLFRHEAASEAVEEIIETVQAARKAVDRPADKIYAGPCDGCGEDLYGRPGAALVTCRWCVDEEGDRLQYEVQARRKWMLAAVEDVELYAPDIARALTTLVRPIAPALLHTWASRGKLSAVPTMRGPVCALACDHHTCLEILATRRPRFRVGDVVDLMIAVGQKQTT